MSINAPYNTLGGFFDGVFGDAESDSEVEIRLEQTRVPGASNDGIFDGGVLNCPAVAAS